MVDSAYLACVPGCIVCPDGECTTCDEHYYLDDLECFGMCYCILRIRLC